ncbi:PREDICTED: tumor necrosis factor receptor superfamily member 10B [Nipponia nippon]|uniref:tumor necrosis factor receptor superfamily member 10B n=1 Tax=Nipponia nippon TaxID=128390 RepID=UPI00051113D4|nr:PREDICTED: tumor necrosis factor receptor superfamily member 10B [Nipponia nippon]
MECPKAPQTLMGRVAVPLQHRPPAAGATQREAVLGVAAVALDRRDKSDPLDASREGEEFYQVQDSDLYCKKCPAGTYVAEHCKEKSGSSKCLPCKEDEYIEYPNDFSKCLGCRTCREDQVELSPCRAISDTQCACRNGTFCSPDHPCEMCQKCRPRCAKDEVELAPCTPHSDRQCGPPTDTFSGSSSKWIIVVLLVAVPVVILLVVFLWKRCCCRSPGEHQDYLVRRLTRYQSGGPGTQDNIRNELFSRDQLLPRVTGSVTPSAPGPQVTGPRTSYPGVKPRRNLVPVQGKDPVSLLRRSFDIFARDVPTKDWKRFGRALGLLENDIALAEMNDKYSLEPFFQMLNMWQNREGMNASVNTLLETLHEINLGGVAEDISSKLVQQGSFQYELI